ncbi:MAG: hypothetical protein Q9208_000344 [Pyrenodesmia sp. 3 TL-2023]
MPETLSPNTISPRYKRAVVSEGLTDFSVTFTGVTVRTAFQEGTNCIDSTGPSIPVTPYYAVTRPASANKQLWEEEVAASFANYVGLPTCLPIRSDVSNRTDSDPVIVTTSAPLAPANTTNQALIPTASPSSSGLGVGAKAAIGVCIPLAMLVIITLAGLGIVKRRKRKSHNSSGEPSAPSKDDQPYLQQKGELEAEERRKYELQAEIKQYELEGDHDIQEMSTPANDLALNRPELRGEEHCKELSD